MARLLAIILISCLSLFASSIGIDRLTYVSGEPGQVPGGFTVTDQSGDPMPYRCDNSSGLSSCAARPSQSTRWILDYENGTVEMVSIPADGLNA